MLINQIIHDDGPVIFETWEVMLFFHSLCESYHSGDISLENFSSALKGLLLYDSEDNLWTIGASSGNWYRRIGNEWEKGKPIGPMSPVRTDEINLHMDQKQQAEQLYDKILDLDPNNADALLSRGQMLLETDLQEDALKYIEQVLNIISSRYDVWLLKALLFHEQDKLDEARLSIDHAIVLSLYSADSWNTGAEILEACGEEALADMYLEMAKYLESSQEKVKTRPSNRNLKEISTEIAELDALLQEHLEYVHAYRDRVAIYVALDELDRSLYYLDKIREKWPKEEDEWFFYRRGVLLLNMTRAGEAEEYFKRVLNINPNNEVALKGLAISRQLLEAPEVTKPILEPSTVHETLTTKNRYCRKCGFSITPNDKFCRKCGAEI